MNKLVDQYNNNYHHSINKEPINADCSAFTEKNEMNHQAPGYKFNDRVRVTLKNSQEKYLFVCSYHVTDAFQSEFTLYSCLNVKELLAQNKCEI